MRKTLGILVTAALLVAGTAVPAQASESHTPANGVFTFSGHGYGHGRGMSQWGAYGAAEQGLSSQSILAFYYPGTSYTGQPNTAIRVRLSTGRSSEVSVDAGAGMSLIWRDGVLALPTKSSTGASILNWRLRAAGGDLILDYVDSSAAVWRQYSFVPGAEASFSSSNGSVFLNQPDFRRREYRGLVGARNTGGNAVLTVNTVPMEDYLRSVVPAEMPSSWPRAALEAQAVAARTYASFERHSATGTTQTCDTTACQVYSGKSLYEAGLSGRLVSTYERATSDAAISATSNGVLVTGGPFTYAFTQFSSSNGGWSVSGPQPYLVARPDPYDGYIRNVANTWSADISTATVKRAYPSVGEPQRIVVLGRNGNGEWGGRVTQVRIEGTAGSVQVTGDALRSALGLRSTWWTTTSGKQLAGGLVVDTTGDGLPDLYARNLATGNLFVYPGRVDGTYGTPRDAGSGWGMHDWLAVVPDASGDGLPDIYARERATGFLWLYTLDRSGVPSSRRVVGSGWDTVDTIVSPGDVDGDGWPDLYGRDRTTGNLSFYRGAPGGGLASVRVVNVGWHSMDAITSAGDVTGDGVPDLLARERSNGNLYLHTVARDGAPVSARQIDGGWGMFDQVVGGKGPGGPFLLGRVAGVGSGSLRSYPISTPGVVRPGVEIGTGWNMHAPIF